MITAWSELKDFSPLTVLRMRNEVVLEWSANTVLPLERLSCGQVPEYACGNHIGRFTMREVADAVQKHALVPPGEVCFKPFRFTRCIAEIRLSLDHQRRSRYHSNLLEFPLECIVSGTQSLAIEPTRPICVRCDFDPIRIGKALRGLGELRLVYPPCWTPRLPLYAREPDRVFVDLQIGR